MSRKNIVEDCPCAVDECSEGDACTKWCMVDLCSKLRKFSRRMHKASADGTQVAWDKLEDFEDDLERAYEWLNNHKGKRRTSCSSRKEVRKLQKACERLRDAYVAEFEDESSDDDDGWVGLETDILHVEILKVEEKEVQKEVGQESLKQPLDTPTLPLECAHRVEMEYPLLKLMSVLSLVNEIYYSDEKQITHIKDVFHGNLRPFEEANNVRNGQVDSRMNGEVMDRERNEEKEVIDLFLDSTENVCRIRNEESKHEEVSKIRCTQKEFATTTRNKSVPEELSPRRSTDVNMQLANLVEIAKDIAANDELIFGNADKAEFYHGHCQAIFQFGSQADDVNVEVEDVQQNADRKVAEDQEIYFEAFKDVILMTTIQFNFGDVLIVESGADLIGLWSTLGQNGSDILCFKSIQLVTEFGLRTRNVLHIENERLGAKMEELKNKSKGIKVSAWGLSKWKPELSSGVLEPDRNSADSWSGIGCEKQLDPDFVAEKAMETNAEGVVGE
ncbi:hypothetical protein L7F22_001358 [Adiantum nelumboides]|nr:hypothetical protein [Adiantum nelumboides]